MAASNAEKSAKWQKANPVKNPKSMMVNNSRIRARKQGVPHTITSADIVYPAVCPVLGVPFDFPTGAARGPTDYAPSLDRIRPELGYVPSNIRVISYRANRIRNDSTIAELELVLAYVRKELDGSS